MMDYDKYEVEDFLHDDFFIEWVLSGTEHHESFWMKWLLQNPGRRDVVEQARSLILSIVIVPTDEELTNNDVDSMVKYIQLHAFKQPQEHNPIFLRFYQTLWFRIAAVILIFATIGILLHKNSSHNPSYQERTPLHSIIKYTNNTDESKLIRMNDGSLAVLKPGSSLRYSNIFSGNQRDVYLEGEAFFEVHKNPKQPFLVHSQNMITKVLGTSFTVRAFSKDIEFKVIVNTGKVMVYQENTTSKKFKPVTLIPNQQVTYRRPDSKLEKDTVPAPLILSEEVAKKEFSYTNTPLSIIIYKLEKAYGVKIEYDEENLGKLILNASLSDRPLDEKVKLLCKAINAHCEFPDGRIVIHTETINDQ